MFPQERDLPDEPPILQERDPPDYPLATNQLLY